LRVKIHANGSEIGAQRGTFHLESVAERRGLIFVFLAAHCAGDSGERAIGERLIAERFGWRVDETAVLGLEPGGENAAYQKDGGEEDRSVCKRKSSGANRRASGECGCVSNEHAFSFG
jgi:hypothetical protein